MPFQMPLRAWLITTAALYIGGVFGYIAAGLWMLTAVVETIIWYTDRRS
jgi:hypothetical protein